MGIYIIPIDYFTTYILKVIEVLDQNERGLFMMNHGAAFEPKRLEPLSRTDARPHPDHEIPAQGLWHSKLVHVEDICNFDDFVEGEEINEEFNDKIHCMI